MSNVVECDLDEWGVDQEREVVLPEGGISERLDAWLSRQCPDLSRARIQALLKAGQITANGQFLKPSAKPKEALVLQLVLPPPLPAVPQPQEIPLEILYEDRDCLVINKPAGLVVHPAPGHPDGTLVNALLYHCHDLQGVGGVERPGIVHRLDKDTSGLMVAAKNDAAMAGFVRLFQTHQIEKEYIAWVHGLPVKPAGTVESLIGRDPRHRQRMAIVSCNGKFAVTHYEMEEARENRSLLRCRIETGRTHQIRVHCQSLGCPILGDALYGKPAADRKLTPVPPRQLLHARRLRFLHPVSGRPLEFVAPPPADFMPYF